MTRQANSNKALASSEKPKLVRFKFAEQPEPVETIIGQCPIDAEFCILDMLAAYEAEDQKLADRLCRAKSAEEIANAFKECPCGCYAGAKKHLSGQEIKWLSALIARYLLLITEAKQLLLLFKLPKELKTLSWNSLPPAEQARIQRLRAKGGVSV